MTRILTALLGIPASYWTFLRASPARWITLAPVALLVVCLATPTGRVVLQHKAPELVPITGAFGLPGLAVDVSALTVQVWGVLQQRPGGEP